MATDLRGKDGKGKPLALKSVCQQTQRPYQSRSNGVFEHKTSDGLKNPN